MPYFIEFLIDNWFIVIPLIFSLFALYLLDRISKAINLEPHKGVVLINKKNALVIDIRSQKEFDEGKISQARHVGPDLEVCKKEIAISFLQTSKSCLLYTSPSPRDATLSRMPSSA